MHRWDGGNLMDKLQAFYKSKKWEAFVKQLRIDRASADGFVICAHCGKPIVKAYDCIAHHKQELTLLNVDDSMVSLNPDNIIFVHFRCHNEIHKRFGFGGKPHGVVKQVYLVYGAPYAGKHTWDDGVADDSAIIVSYDRLWQSIRHGNGKPRALTDNVFGLYDCLIDMVKVRRGRWHSAYIIGGFPSSGQRERTAEVLGVNKSVFIDTPMETCLVRAKAAGAETQYIQDWFEKYSPLPS